MAALGGSDFLLRRGKVARQAVPVVNDDIRLQLENHLVHLRRFPLLCTERPIDVIPEHIDLSVLRHEFADQAVRVFHEPHACRFIGQTSRTIGVVPIHQRIVETYAQTLGARRFHVFGHQVTSARLFGRAIVGQLGLKIAKALVMLGGHYHILLAGAFRELGPLPRGVGLGIEMLCEPLILSDGNSLHLHRPLVLTNKRIKSKMDEHAESSFVPPLHTPLAVGPLLGTLRARTRRSLSKRRANAE